MVTGGENLHGSQRDAVRTAGGVTAVTRADLLRFRLSSFQRKLDRARAIVGEALGASQQPYIAWSGGKDSLVVLALAAQVRPGIEAIWCDHELEPEPSVAYLTAIGDVLPVRLIVAKCYSPHGGWFRPWQQEPPFRPPVPGTRDMGDSPRLASPRHGYDLALLGLRSEEAIHRRHNAKRGRWYRVQSGQWHGQPIVGWTVDDVWAAIAGLELPYNPAYDRFTAVGVPRTQQRVGPLPLSPGWILRAAWPDLSRRLVERYGPRWG